jgi:predicted dehydrogenase
MRQTGLFDIVACYDLDEEALQRACEEENATACGSFEELLGVPDTEVVVSTGATSHAEYILGALEAGKHVFVEKPLAGTAEKIGRMIEAKEESGLVVGVGHNYEPANPLNQLVRQYREEDKLGRVTAVEANAAHSGALAADGKGWRFDPGRNPGGMLFQSGSAHRRSHYFQVVPQSGTPPKSHKDSCRRASRPFLR